MEVDMSTRCNVKIKMGKTVVWFYRHHDGYPSETGADLYGKIADSKNFTDMIQNLLNDACYEITDQQHGDIEWMYEFDWETETRIKHIQCANVEADLYTAIADSDNNDNMILAKNGDFFIGNGIEAVGGYCNFVLNRTLRGN